MSKEGREREREREVVFAVRAFNEKKLLNNGKKFFFATFHCVVSELEPQMF